MTLSADGTTLRSFVEDHLSSHCRARPTNLYSLYHNREILSQAKEKILHQVQDRNLWFPAHSDLEVPLISTLDGSFISRSALDSRRDLLDIILDMTLLERTDWVAVQNTILSKAQEEANTRKADFQVYNYGPGYGALKGRKDLPERVRVIDVSCERSAQNARPPRCSPNDIAIVGMGINLPGAEDTQALWQNLMSGFNACSEVLDIFSPLLTLLMITRSPPTAFTSKTTTRGRVRSR